MEGNYLNFPSKIFCLTVPKHFVEEPLFAVYQKIASKEKVYGNEMGRGEYQKFPSKIFCLKLPKQIVGEPPYSLISFGYRKCLCFSGLCHNFPWNSLSHSTETFRRETLLCCVSENFW